MKTTIQLDYNVTTNFFRSKHIVHAKKLPSTHYHNTEKQLLSTKISIQYHITTKTFFFNKNPLHQDNSIHLLFFQLKTKKPKTTTNATTQRNNFFPP